MRNVATKRRYISHFDVDSLAHFTDCLILLLLTANNVWWEAPVLEADGSLVLLVVVACCLLIFVVFLWKDYFFRICMPHRTIRIYLIFRK